MYKKKETLIGYAFVAPALISFFVLVAFPFFFPYFWHSQNGIFCQDLKEFNG